MGCSSVCQSLAVIAASLFLPILSFECSAGEELSNQELFPDFTRLGTSRNKLPEVLMYMKESLGWNHIAIVTGEEVGYKDRAIALQSALPEMPSSVQSVQDWETAKSVMNTVRKNKHRVVFFIGPDHLFRQIICASDVVGTRPGVTWVSEGIKSRSWWTETDEALLEDEPTCTAEKINELVQGALSISGYGEPEIEDRDKKLTCFASHTSQSLNAYIKDKLEVGYPPSDPNATGVDYPYDHIINLAVDGMCVFAQTVRLMLDEGRDIKELRTPSQDIYRQMVRTIKQKVNFVGTSGQVKFSGNDIPAHLATWQVNGNQSSLAGLVNPEGVININYESGLRNDSYTEAPADPVPPPEEGFPILAVVIPTLAVFFCGIICYAAYTGRAATAQRAGNNVAS